MLVHLRHTLLHSMQRLEFNLKKTKLPSVMWMQLRVCIWLQTVLFPWESLYQLQCHPTAVNSYLSLSRLGRRLRIMSVFSLLALIVSLTADCTIIGFITAAVINQSAPFILFWLVLMMSKQRYYMSDWTAWHATLIIVSPLFRIFSYKNQ